MRPKPEVPTEVGELLCRSRLLGSDPRLTNYAGGNTSCKTESIDPATGQSLRLLWIKGSGGDLGTLTFEGLSALVLDRLLALERIYSGPEREAEMVELLDYCLFGQGGAAPSIDTPLHALLPPAHVDHLHPDAVIALASSRDGEALVRECYGTEVAWIPWRRPGFELAVQIAAVYAAHPGLRAAVLEGHGLFSWGETSEECKANTLEVIHRAEQFLKDRGRPEPFGVQLKERAHLPSEERLAKAAALGPVIRGLCSTDRRVVGHFRDDPVVLDFLSSEKAGSLAEAGTSCPDHFLRTKVRPMLLDLPPRAAFQDQVTRLKEMHAAYREHYSAYYKRYAKGDSPPMRGADPAIVLLPGIGMWSFGSDARTARVAGEFYINALNVIRGAESISSYQPIPEPEKFAIEYWSLEEAKLKRRPPEGALAGRISFVTGAGSGIGRAIAHRLASEGAAVVVSDIDGESAGAVASELGGSDRAVSIQMDVSDEAQVSRALRTACVAFGGVDLIVNDAGLSISKPLIETTEEDWDLQHSVIAKGSFLVSKAAAKIMIEQGLGGDIVYVVSKNALFAGPSNFAYGAAKADQAHQVRLLAAELGEHGIRVNGVNPDGVVRGSRIFSEGWGANRATLYGVEEKDLGKFYAERTLLKREVFPEHVAATVFALVGADMALTTGTIIPVDGGVTAAFLR